MVTRTPARAAKPGPRRPDAIAAFGSLGSGYDANGDRTSRADPGPPAETRTSFYDPERRPVRTESTKEPPPYTLWRAAYDGDGVRRKRVDDLGTIHYVGAYERNVGNGNNVQEVITKYYIASFGKVRRLIALRRGGTLYWIGTDHLGSTIRTASATFAAVDQERYLPFGGSRDSGASLQTDHKFTGQIEDAAVGLYWYASRHYDAGLARHPQPDTVVPQPGNPQSLNRYSYALNNPLKLIDPSGHASLNAADLNNTLEDFIAASWEERHAWFVDFNQRYGLDGWFNNILGILEYFAGSAVFSQSQWARVTDAAVIWVIQEGLAGVINPQRDLFAEGRPWAAIKWSQFFYEYREAVRLGTYGSGAAETRLRHLWGEAEQTGVNYALALGMEIAPASSNEADLRQEFVRYGNDYRTAVRESKPVFHRRVGPFIVGVGPIANPRRDRELVYSLAVELESGKRTGPVPPE